MAALLFGVYYGITNVMMPLFTRKSFGDAEYVQIYSRVSMVNSISNVVGGFLWGTLVSFTGSYAVMFGGAIALMLTTMFWKVMETFGVPRSASFFVENKAPEIIWDALCDVRKVGE